MLAALGSAFVAKQMADKVSKSESYRTIDPINPVINNQLTTVGNIRSRAVGSTPRLRGSDKTQFFARPVKVHAPHHQRDVAYATIMPGGGNGNYNRVSVTIMPHKKVNVKGQVRYETSGPGTPMVANMLTPFRATNYPY